MNVLRFSGPSNSGKTTFICELTGLLTHRGLRVAFLKNSHHSLPSSNKDTDRLLQAGALGAVLTTPNTLQMTTALGQRAPQELIDWLFPDVDAVLVEGWRIYDLPTILICPTAPPPEWKHPDNIVGCVGWSPTPELPMFTSPQDIAHTFFFRSA